MNLPNKLTVLRVLLIPFFVASLLYKGGEDYKFRIVALIIFAVAAITDTLDGMIARKYNLITDFGKFMDPLADKVLVTSALVCLVQIGRVEAWMVVLIISREYAISILRAIAASTGKVLAASKGGKIKTATQMIAIIMLMLAIPGGNILMYLAVFFTAYSGVQYIYENRHLIETY